MKKKKIMSLMMAVMMVAATILVGCGSSSGTGGDSGSGSNSGVTEVTFWTLNTRQEAVEPIVEEFNSQNDDIVVTAAFYDTDGIKDACKVASSSGTLPNMWFNWGGSLGSFYADNGLTYDLTDYASENGWNDKFNTNALELCTYDDKLSGYPTSYNILGIYYRKDIFAEYNLEVPTTFEEFEEVCATLKENGITPISTAGLNGWHTMRFVELLIEHYAGTETHDAMNTFDESWDNDAVTKAFEKYKEFVDKGYFPDGFLTQDPNDTLLALANGECAMDIQGQWNDGQILQNGLDIENYGVFAFPSDNGDRMSSFAEMTQFNANNTDAELEACIAFTEFYNSQEHADEYSDYFNLPLPFADAEMPDNQTNVPIMIETGETNGTFTITDQALPTEVADVLFDSQEAVANGQMDPSEVGVAIQSAIESYNSK